MPGSRTSGVVSVVIPTRNRPALLTRAIASVLAQTHAPAEIIVVIDGPDPLTFAGCARCPDPRLRVIALDESVGGAEARNVGVRAATGDWIAFLDDDDEWIADKLETQLAATAGLAAPFPIVSSRLFARGPEKTDIWPLNPPTQPLSEYLLVRRRLRFGEGLLQTSTLLVKRELLLRVPFQIGLRKHQDWDWLLRVNQTPGAALIFVEEPLSIWHRETRTNRVSHDNHWRSSLAWIHSVKHLVTRRAYASFLANSVVRQAAAEGAWPVAPSLFAEAFREGSPGLLDFALLTLPWLIPTAFAQSLQRLLTGYQAADCQLSIPSISIPSVSIKEI